MPRSGRDFMWSESLSLALLGRQGRGQPEVFRPTESGWEPPVDVLETDAGLLVVMALPGVKREDVQVLVGNGELLVRGTRRWPIRQRPALVHRVELPHGRFERRLPLPQGTFQLAGQEYTDGCLLLTLRRLA